MSLANSEVNSSSGGMSELPVLATFDFFLDESGLDSGCSEETVSLDDADEVAPDFLFLFKLPVSCSMFVACSDCLFFCLFFRPPLPMGVVSEWLEPMLRVLEDELALLEGERL